MGFHNWNDGTRGGDEAGLTGSMMLYLLIGANMLVFLGGSGLAQQFAVKSWDFSPLQIVTAMFAHANFSHVFFNMFGLWIFGSLIADRLGAVRMLLLYLIAGAAGNLLFLAFPAGSQFSLLGASGAVYGVMMATAMMEPDRRFVFLFLPVPVRTKTLVIVYTIIELLSQLGGGGSVAHLAHLGGFLGGFLYMRFAAKELLLWIPFRGMRNGVSPQNTPFFTGTRIKKPFSANAPVTQHELDYLLTKIAKTGINSLMPEEMARLKKAREQMQEK